MNTNIHKNYDCTQLNPLTKKLRFKKLKLKNGLQIIPNLFTLGNALFGFCSVIFAAEGEIVASAYCIFLGAIMDSLDGQIARMIRGGSEFGLQLDSLCDAITFCLAPAFLVYSWQLYKFGCLGGLVCAILLILGIFRLAKFNVTANSQAVYFIGVPTPLVACFLSAIVLNFCGSCIHFWGRINLSLIILITSGLMVSLVKIPTFKHVRKGWYAVVIAGLSVATMVFSLTKILMVTFSAYFIFVIFKGIFSHFKHSINLSNIPMQSNNELAKTL